MDIAIHPAPYNGKDMRAWLEERPHYTLDEASVLYSSEATGVEFCFNFYDPGFYPPDVPHQPHVMLYLEYFRPHVFALEAEPELAGFLRQFNCRVEDVENNEAMGVARLDGPYSREAFLVRWNAGNRAAFRQAAGSRAPPPWSADPALIEAVWKWNYGRAALQKTTGDKVFVPRIIWARPEGAGDPVPACMWTDRVPTMIPETLVSHIALVRPPRQGLMDMLGLSRSGGKPKFELKLAGVKGVSHMPGMDRGEAHGQPVFYTPLVQTTEMNRLFSGVWQPDAASIVPTEHVCGADLVALLKKA